MKKKIVLLGIYTLLSNFADSALAGTVRQSVSAELYPAQPAQGAEKASKPAQILTDSIEENSDSSEALKVLPSSKEIDGWHTDGEVLVFFEDNLWEYMNGAAEKFLSFGFEELAVGNYISSEGAGIEVEAFLHSSTLNAYGIYAQMRNPELEFLEIGNEAFKDELSVQFWKGCFYIRVSVFEKTPKLEAAAEAFARAIAAKIENGGDLPAELACFPQEGLITRDIRYIAEGVLGREKYPASFVARYIWGKEKAELYLSSLRDTSEAVSVYRWFSEEIGAKEISSRVEERTYTLARGRDPYRGHAITFRYGRWLVSILGLSAESDRAEKLARETMEKLAALEQRELSAAKE